MKNLNLINPERRLGGHDFCGVNHANQTEVQTDNLSVSGRSEVSMTLDEQPCNHPVITPLSPSNHPLLPKQKSGKSLIRIGKNVAESHVRKYAGASRVWKYAAMVVLMVTLGVGEMWGDACTKGQVFYFKPSTSNPDWTADGARFAVKFRDKYGASDYVGWYSCQAVPGDDDMYYAVAPEAVYHFQLCRMPGNDATNEDSKVWTWGDDLEWQSSNHYNYFEKKSDGKWNTFDWLKYAPPMASATISKSTTTIYGGEGTEANPYQVEIGSTVYLDASATSSVPADNQTKYYQFYKKEGDGTRSTLGSKTTTSTASFTASSSADVIYEIDVVAQNEYYSTYGTGATSDKIYFITVDPIYAILGSFNSWNHSATTWDLSDQSSGNWDATFHLDKGDHTFKVVFNSVHNGNGATITRASNSTTGLSSSGSNMTIKADVSGDYTFRYNTSGSLTVTYPTAYTVTYGMGTGGASVSASATSAGGTFSSGALVRSGDEVTFTQTAATGYSFKGWYTASSGGTTAGVDGSGHLTIDAAKTVYAQYDPNDYVITLDQNTGSTDGSVTATYNSTATKSFTAANKTGYDCTGYWTAESGGYKVVNTDGTLVSYSDNISDYLNSDGTWKKTDATTLYAQWTAQTYTITLDENGDYQGNGSATATYDSGLSGISLPSRTGYHVEGYYKEDTYTNKIANADGTLCATTGYTDASSHWTHVGAVTLYTKWTANTYTVHFDPNDENYVGDATGSMEDQGFTYDAAQALTANGFSREGYTFAGWNSQEDGEGTDYTDEKSVNNLTAENGGSVTLYAKWTAKDYDVTLNYGMGERGTNPASITVTMGATYVSSSDLTSLSNHLPTLADASGYYFTGWYTSPSGGTKITDETIVTTASAHTLYARFVERSYVYFYNNLGWENVYVVFNAYWTDNKGVGSNGREKLLMEHIGNNIWRYLIPEYALKTEWQHFIAFSNTNAVDGSHHFYSGKAVFRKDFDSYATMFVPASGGTTFVPSEYSGAGNGITYYSTDQWNWNESSPRHKDGYWKRYNSTEGGYTIKGSWDSWANDNYLKSVTTDGWTYSFSKYLDANTTYQFLLYKHCTTSNTATSTFTAYPTNTITSSACTDIKFTTQNVLLDGDDKNSKITTTAAGEYVFTLTCGTDGTLKLSVKYPLTANQEYRVLYSWNDGSAHTHASEYIHVEPGTSKKISVFVHKSSAVTSRSLTIQKCTAIDGSGNPTWTNVNTIDLSSVGESGVYNFVITQPASGEPTGAYSEPYTGDYYIRTDAADGGWDFYKEIGDNKMKLSEFSLTQELSDPYSHYYCKFINSTSTNITYQIATDYSPCVSEVMVGDATIGDVSTKTLPATANVRFSWNCKTNALRRAYLKDAQGDSNARYLVLHGADGKILNTDGRAIAASDDDDLKENELQFTDNGNWVYQVSLKAQPGANVCLIANYNDDDRYLVGNGSSDWLTIMGGSGTSTYDITAVYDFKTNRLMTAWTPSGVIKDQLENVDVMLVRHAQENANTITFAENKTTHTMGSLTANKIIGALEMRYDELFGSVTNWTSESRPLLKFMVSFPFDVNVSDVFGLNSAYGEAYVIERYAGDERAAKGFFRGDGTSTFWTELEPGDVMKANEGYCVILDNEYFNGDLGKVWENKGTGSKVYLYFPSASNVGAINATEKSYTVPAHTCEINRTFGSPAKNHMNTDSHWNLIGVPIFADHAASSAEGTPGAVLTNEGDYFHHFYEWNPTDNQFYIATASSTVFKAMYSYMVQYHGDIKFVGAATPTPSSVAARRAPEKKNYEIELQVLNNDAEMINRTYVELRDEAEDGFMLNEDVYMSTNNKAVNIYTFAGNYDVAANVQSVNNHTIPVGVIVNKTGTYSFSMPSNFDGTVTLIDNFTQTRTNLALEDYEIQLEKGTINDRFLLEIDIHKVSTAIDGVTDGTGSLKDGKAHKFIENGAMYILRDGVVYDARGTKVK